LGIALIEAAFGAAQVAVANMTALVRAVTTLRGRDPRDFALVASGESGPAYAAYLARSLGMSTVSATAGSVERRRNDRV
jgi:N-methylhydantoinase A